jgi:hypothetical protein
VPLPDSHYTQLEARLWKLDGLVAEVTPEASEWFRRYVDVGEYGVAVEGVVEELDARTTHERASELARRLLPEAETMELPEAALAQLRSVTGG